MADAPAVFRRDYLLRLPLPLAQLYGRAHNAKEARARHDHCFYLFEALIKLTACPLIACYVEEVRGGGPRVAALDRLVAQLALPSLGQWVGMVRTFARHFGMRPDAPSHPLGHLQGQLERKVREPSPILALYRRIRNGPDGEPSGDETCSLLQLFEALVQYRNGVLGHGAGRFESFFEKEMGPLLWPAVTETLAEGVLDPLGPKGSALVYVEEVRRVGEDEFALATRDLVGMQSERAATLTLDARQAAALLPDRVAIRFSSRAAPLPLDPLLRFRAGELAEETLFLNRDRLGRRVEYLSYTTGRVESSEPAAPALAALLSTATGRDVTPATLERLAEQSLAETASIEAVLPETPGPRVLGDYEVVAELGRGGMGIVYLARQRSLGRVVALKTLPSDLAGDASSVARFGREMRALSQCEHPNIVKLLDSGTLPDGQAYYTMEYVPGCDLEQVWQDLSKSEGAKGVRGLSDTTLVSAVHSAAKRKREDVERRMGAAGADVARLPLPPLPPIPSAAADPEGYVRRVVALLRDAARGLAAVHERGIVHRDVSPANLVLTPDGQRVVLMDFGLAKRLDGASAATRVGGFVGKLRYAAPEQLAAAVAHVGPAADVRGLGVTLWEMLTRRRLFAEAEDESQIASSVLGRDVPRLRSVDPAFDRDLEAIVARATERNQADRIPTATLLADTLTLWLEGKPVPFRSPGPVERSRRWLRRHRGVGVGALLLLVLAIAGAGWRIWRWDAYERPYVSYYASSIARFGVSEGVCPLTEEQVAHREGSVRHTRRGRLGPVVRAEIVGPSGGTATDWEFMTDIESDKEEDASAGSVKRTEYTYDADGVLRRESAFGQGGRPLFEVWYKSRDHAEYVVNGYVRARTRSGAAHVEYERYDSGPARGLEKAKRWRDRDGKPQPGSDGTYGRLAEYDERGLMRRMEYIDDRDQRMRNADRYAIEKRTFNAWGDLDEVAYFDPAEKPTRCKQGYSIARWEHDAWGNRTSMAVYDERERPTTHVDGWHRLAMARDENGREVARRYFDLKGTPFSPSGASAVVKTTYGAQGDVERVSYFEADGTTPATNEHGYHEWRTASDPEGRPIEYSYWAADGTEALCESHYHRVRREYDAHGLLRNVTYWGRKGEPVGREDGVHRATYSRDARGALESVVYADPGGHPVAKLGGYWRRVFTRDASGNITEEATEDADGKPHPSIEGHWKDHVSFEDGRAREWRYLDADGRLTMTPRGYAIVTETRDARGRLETTSYKDERGIEAPGRDGYASMRCGYDARDNRTSEAYFDARGNATLHDDGYAVVRWTYDAWDREIETRYEDGKENLVRSRKGYAGFRTEYDARGHVSAHVCLGLDGAPAPCDEGWVRADYRRDAAGRVLETTYRDREGQPVFCKDGYVTRRVARDARGFDVLTTNHDASGALVRCSEGWAARRRTFDDRGRATEEAWFADEGTRPATDRSGWARLAYSFDDADRIAEILFFDPEGAEHALREVRTYGARGALESSTLWGPDGERVRGAGGYSRKVRTYDARGLQTEERYFDEKDRPVRCTEGYEVVRWKHDERGRVIERRHEDTKGTLLAALDGCAIRTLRYDARGNVREEINLGTDERPVALTQGFARVVCTPDSLDRVVRWDYFAADGAPRHQVGYASVTVAFDALGRQTEQAYLGASGQAVAGADGWHREVVSYDEKHRVREWIYFWKDETPAWCREGGHRAIATYDEEGERTLAWYDPEGPVTARQMALREFFWKRPATTDAAAYARWLFRLILECTSSGEPAMAKAAREVTTRLNEEAPGWLYAGESLPAAVPAHADRLAQALVRLKVAPVPMLPAPGDPVPGR